MAAGRTFIVWLAVLAVLAAVGYAWMEKNRRDEAELDLGLASSRMINVTFEKAAMLKVGTISGDVVTRSDACRLMSTICAAQVTRAPGSVDYFVNLADLPVSSYRWNREAKVMTVDLPPVLPATPNIDMSRAAVRQRGIWITRSMSAELNKVAATRLRERATKEAAMPANMARMQAHARDAMQRIVAAPLAAAGMGDVTVIVRLPGEAKPDRLSQEQWDLSRPLREVLAETR